MTINSSAKRKALIIKLFHPVKAIKSPQILSRHLNLAMLTQHH
jgi:hypothetical protein